jgi:hypothetical protein
VWKNVHQCALCAILILTSGPVNRAVVGNERETKMCTVRYYMLG